MKWVVWVPWLKRFVLNPGGTTMVFNDEASAVAWAQNANVPLPLHPNNGNHNCKGHRYVAVPWDAQAQQIASSGAI